jgi:hypothetical protein
MPILRTVFHNSSRAFSYTNCKPHKSCYKIILFLFQEVLTYHPVSCTIIQLLITFIDWSITSILHHPFFEPTEYGLKYYILSCVCVTIDRVWTGDSIYWWLIHDSKLHAITVPPLISTIQKSPQHPLSGFPACCLHQPFPGNSFQQWRFFSFTHSGPLLTASRTELKYTNWAPNLLVITSWHGPHRKQFFHFCDPAVASSRIGCLATGICLPSRCPETVDIYRVTA